LGTSLDNHVVSIFMQFVPGGTVASLLSRFGALEERVFRRYTLQIVNGVGYLHDNGVIHRYE
jgi:mitogen-activated protein kinase kinase kinase 19